MKYSQKRSTKSVKRSRVSVKKIKKIIAKKSVKRSRKSVNRSTKSARRSRKSVKRSAKSVKRSRKSAKRSRKSAKPTVKSVKRSVKSRKSVSLSRKSLLRPIIKKSTKRYKKHSRKVGFKSPMVKNVTPLKDVIKDLTYSDEENKQMQEELELEEMEEEINKKGLSEDDIETLELYLDKKYLIDLKNYFENFPENAFDKDIEYKFSRACYWINKTFKRNKKVRVLIGKLQMINDFYKNSISNDFERNTLFNIEQYFMFVHTDIEKVLKKL